MVFRPVLAMNDIVRYIIQFLLGDEASAEVVDSIGYTSDNSIFHNYKIVITPSGFFDEKMYGMPASIPALPLQQIEDTPILFGKPFVEEKDDVLIVYADLVASSYFLLSRYEEMVRRDIRDEHGRFPGRSSLPFRADMLHRPLVDEYGRLLRKWLMRTSVKAMDRPRSIRRINLTHDVDAPFAMRTWRNMVRGVKEGKGLGMLLQTKFGSLEKDPFYTFPWLLSENQQVRTCYGKENCTSIFFFKAGGNGLQDKPYYNLYGKDMQSLFQLIADNGGMYGLHSSYQAGKRPQQIAEEKGTLECALGTKITSNRHHFLASREPEDMAELEKAGLTDDYTMGYADVAGFRLGTSRPVRWIDAANKRLSLLTLHPLIIMDGTLSETKYMGLGLLEAKAYCDQLIEQVREHHGELTLLWHNTSVVEGSGYHSMLYHELLQHICAGG